MLHVILRPALGMTIAVLAAFPVAASAAPATAAVTCPTVDPQTGLLTPAPSPGVDWSGCNLHNAFIRGSLAGANLSNANLTNAFLDVLDLTSANLDGANLSPAFLDSVNMTTASLNGA